MDLIVAGKGAVLPFRCVKCNEAVDPAHAIRKHYVWIPRAAWFAFLGGEIVHLTVSMLLRKQGTVTFCLCDLHRARSRRARRLGWVLIPTGCSALLAGGLQVLLSGWEPVSGLVAVLGGVVSIGALVAASIARPLKPWRIGNYYVWLKGASPAFLAELPSLVRQ